ncbi:MAG TPA: Fic family protein [Telluria sp.]|nr:Fic family protein [Telluria sp.]
MILFELTGDEADPVYQALQIANVARQYDFLRSIVTAAISADRRFLSQHVIKALNFHAITCLHANPGEYRPWFVTVGAYEPPPHYRVQALMDDFVNFVNSRWESSDPLWLAAFVLWRLNHIHPFINGNGRTARAICYFVLCLKFGGWLVGQVTLPELISRDRDDYVVALREVDASLAAGALDVTPLQKLLDRLLREQLATVGIIPPVSK